MCIVSAMVEKIQCHATRALYIKLLKISIIAHYSFNPFVLFKATLQAWNLGGVVLYYFRLSFVVVYLSGWWKRFDVPEHLDVMNLRLHKPLLSSEIDQDDCRSPDKLQSNRKRRVHHSESFLKKSSCPSVNKSREWKDEPSAVCPTVQFVFALH